MTSRSTIVAGFLVLSALAWSRSLLACDDKPGRADQAPFHIQAHRGAGIARPENTLESFMWSWQRQVTPEADLRTTKDGVIVCFHDKNFKRVVSNIEPDRAKLGIKDLPIAEIEKLEVGSFRGEQFAGQHIPRLSRVFAEMTGHPQRLIYLDIKQVDLDALVRMIRKYKVASQVILATKHHKLIREWKQRVPESLTLLWNGGSEKELTKRLEAVRKADFEGITHLQIHVKVGDLDSDEPFMPSIAFLEKTRDELKARGIVFQVLPWKCSDPRAYARLLDLGVESFATDYPELTLKAVQAHRAKCRKGGKG